MRIDFIQHMMAESTRTRHKLLKQQFLWGNG